MSAVGGERTHRKRAYTSAGDAFRTSANSMHLARIGLAPYILSAAPSARDAATGAHLFRDGKPKDCLKRTERRISMVNCDVTGAGWTDQARCKEKTI